jgi:lipopolysaccharide/colanic/teichoic acid biosynthesis glycosyltransferase
LERRQFLQQLQFERRRTDRTRTPFSIVHLRIDGQRASALIEMRRLASLLLQKKRETDALGRLGDGHLSLLLIDTNREGAEAVACSISRELGDLPQPIITTVTYPDHVLESLLCDAPNATQVHSYLLGGRADLGPVAGFVKRSIDLVGALSLLLIASPIMLLTAIAVRMTSPGPVIFSQLRLGKHGVPFRFYKFRSMRVDADDQIHREYVASLIEGKLDKVNQGDAARPLYKIKDDPRITRVGRFIRATSIDELPQLLNVLTGEMSLIGPRPPLPYEAQRYQSWHLARILDIRPGLTGLWQVEGRSRTSFDEMVRMDLRYLRDWSLLLDLKILLKTVLVVVKRDGAK